jgi:polysaccharide export outer membrane protein
VLSPGDLLEISFPGATNFSALRRVSPEGVITMPIVGQVPATGKTAAQFESDLEKLYAKELQDNDAMVTLVDSANLIYVMGAVSRPGRVLMNRPLTALEAILEAGGFSGSANMERVTIVRYIGDTNTLIHLNLDPIYEGGLVLPFYVKPRDIIYIPTKMQWF